MPNITVLKNNFPIEINLRSEHPKTSKNNQAKNLNIGLAGDMKINRIPNTSRMNKASKSFYQKAMKTALQEQLLNKQKPIPPRINIGEAESSIQEPNSIKLNDFE
jgi:hypothetical protein